MRKVALFMGIIAGVINLIGAITVMSILSEAEYFGTSLNLSWVGIPVALIAICGGFLVKSRPVLAAVLMIVGGLIGVIFVEIIGFFTCLVLIVAAILALISRKSANNTAANNKLPS